MAQQNYYNYFPHKRERTTTTNFYYCQYCSQQHSLLNYYNMDSDSSNENRILPSVTLGEEELAEGNFKTWSGVPNIINNNNNKINNLNSTQLFCNNKIIQKRQIGRFECFYYLQKQKLEEENEEDKQIILPYLNNQNIKKEDLLQLNYFSGRNKIKKFIDNNIKERFKYFGGNISSQQKSTIPTFFQHFARFFNQFGIRHFLLISILVLYAIFGGLMFQAIERDNEIENVQTTTKILNKLIIKIKTNISTLFFVKPTNEEKLKLIIIDGYTEMLKIEGRYIGSVFHKYETLALNNVLNWYFGSSIFYAMTLFTTIGYGTIACQTALGKLASIVYAMFGIPMMLMVLGDVGQLILLFLIYCRKSVKEYYNRWLLRAYVSDIDEDLESKIKKENKINKNKEEEEEEEEEFPLSLLMLIVAFYILIVSAIVSLLDWSKDGKLLKEGLGFGDSFYFSFLSLATIGLGDVMPYNLQYTPLLAVLFLAGLALLSLVNSTIYIRLQNRFLAIMDCLEDFLEKIQYTNKKSFEGYSTFMSLSPSIKFLATALPLDFLENKNLKNLKTCRSKSMNAVGDKKQQQIINNNINLSSNNFRPTLGVMTAANSPSQRPSRQSTFNMGNENNLNNKRRRLSSKDGGIFLNKPNDMRKRAMTISHADEASSSMENKDIIKFNKKRISIDNDKINKEKNIIKENNEKNEEDEEQQQHHHQLLLSARGLLLRWADQQEETKEEEKRETNVKEKEEKFNEYYNYYSPKPTTSMQRRIYSRRGSRDVNNLC